MTKGIGQYEIPDAALIEAAASANVIEIMLTAFQQPVDISGGIIANAETFKRSIPAPTLRLNDGHTEIVRLARDKPHPGGFHWRRIELGISTDGTSVTRDWCAVGPFTASAACAPADRRPSFRPVRT